MHRRDFLKLSAAGAGATLVAPSAVVLRAAATDSTPASDLPRAPVAERHAPAPKNPLVGIQLGVTPLMRPDLNRTLDDLQARAGVNALFPFIFGNTARWAPMPAAGFRGGNFGIPHLQYYDGLGFTYEDMRAPEAGDMDVFGRTIEAARPRGIKTFAWILEDIPQPLKKWKTCYEVDYQGRQALGYPSGRCYNHPLYRGFMTALVEDYARSYPIDGVMWSSERQGGLLTALGAWAHGEKSDPGRATCFCEHCVKRGRDAGIDVERARQGFAALDKFVRAGRAGQRPDDGYFVAFFRLLLNYPELLAWERLWIRSRLDFMGAMYAKAKGINPALQVGWHVWHTVSFSPFHRAEMDYAEMAEISDFLKPVLYSNCAGERMRSFVESVGQNVMGDFPPSESTAALYRMLNYDEAPYERVRDTGFSAEYVRRETARAVAATMTKKRVQIWPGLDVDVPVSEESARCTAESVKQTVLAAFAGGASGVILSRNYSEMDPVHLAGAGQALVELGLK